MDKAKETDLQQVSEGEKRYRHLFEVSSEGILVIDDQGRYVDVNASFCRILKASRERLVGAHFSEFVPPDRLDEAFRAFADWKTGGSVPVEFPLRALDGSIVELEWSSASHYPPNLSFCMCRDIGEARRAQALLQASEERQRRAVEAGKVGLWEWDIETNRVTWSDYIYELHGIPPGTFDGSVDAFTALVDPRDRDLVSASLQKALAGAGEYHVEFRALRPDGRPQWLETSGRVTFDAGGRPLMMHGAVLDTTARREAEETQREIERQLMLLVEGSAALLSSPHSAEVLRTIIELAQRFVSADAHAVWRGDSDGGWRLCSSAGLSEEYVKSGVLTAAGAPSLPAGPMVFEDIAQEPLLALRHQALIREGVRSMTAIPLRIQGRPSGTVVFYWKSPHRVSASEIRIATALGNLAAAALGAAELYDKQLELRAQAQAAGQRAAFLAEAGAVLSSSLDYNSTLTAVANLAIPVFADWASVDVLDGGHELRRVAIAHQDPARILFASEFARRYPPREDDASLVALRTGQSILIEEVSGELIEQRSRDAEQLRLLRELGIKSVIVAPMVMNARSLGIITFVTAESGRRYNADDLQTAEELARRAATALENARLYHESRQSQAELQSKNEALRRANDDLNQFAYSASHDLQEPLRMVSIYSQLLQKQYGSRLDAAADQYLQYTVDGARRLERLLRDILAYTQAANPASPETAEVNSNAVLEKALANLHGAIAETGARVCPRNLPVLHVQEIHLLQLFQNLVGNAIKYKSSDPPLIEVSAGQEPEGWLFAVKDNGIGIDPQYKEQIFGLFKRLHSSEDYSGTGVGLAICQKIVERYRGRIWVESQPGRGSTFFFTLAAPR